jgi:NADH-quinone oxidoreductase subunit N
MWVFMLSFAGLPLTGGFFAKFYVFSAAFDSGMWWLVVVGAVATAVSLYYYLSIIRSMYMRPAAGTGQVTVAGGSPPSDDAVVGALAICLVVTIGSFFAVGPLVDLATKAASALF